MNEQEDILELVEMLYTMVTEAWGVPLGNDKCMIERGKALDLIEEIKNKLPAEIAEAKRLVARRDDFINNAKREGEAMRKAAEERARKLVDEQEVVKKARIRSGEMIAAAEGKARKLRMAADSYVDDALRRAEESMTSALDTVRQSRAQFRKMAGSSKETLPEE